MWFQEARHTLDTVTLDIACMKTSYRSSNKKYLAIEFAVHTISIFLQMMKVIPSTSKQVNEIIVNLICNHDRLAMHTEELKTW